MIKTLIFLFFFSPFFLVSQSLNDLFFGADNNLNVISWNLEWFAKNDQTTIDSLSVAINALDVDVIAVQEISNTAEFQSLINQLNGYSGYYSVSNLRLGFIYKSSLNVNSISSIFSNNSYNFAGRPPLLMYLNFNSEDFFIFNVHLKCCGDGVLDLTSSSDEENRRFNSLNMIKNYIDQYHSTDNIVILGDYNDLLTDASPDNIFSQFIIDSANYTLADFHIANGNSSNWSYPSWPSHLDHIIVSNELTDNFNNNNVQTIRIDNYLNGGFTSYDAIISDHLPVGISFINSISGCTDSTAINFNASANIDDGSCTFSLLPCSDLFISEYVCGTSYYSHDKAIEIYNPTNNTVNLNDYQLERYRNGDTNSLLGGVTQLSGSLLPGDVWIVTNGDTVDVGYGIISPILYNLRDQAAPDGSYPTPLHMNGDDAIILSKVFSGQIIDVIGKIGEDPGIGWTADSTANFTDANGEIVWTRNHTLVRKSNILSADNYGNDLFNPSLQWDSLSLGTWSNLGVHNCDCPVYGCTDASASNYNSTVNTDDGSCIWLGCTDATADNYDAIATVDDGTCTYTVCTAPSPTGAYVTELTFMIE